MENGKVDQVEIIRERLEKMVALEQAMDHLRDELNDSRREARSEGLDVQVVNALLPLFSKHPHDKGAGVMNEAIRYAEIYGAVGLTSQASARSHSLPEPSSRTEAQNPVKAEVRLTGPLNRAAGAHARLGLSAQVVAAVGLTIGLIWLLN